MKTLPHFISAIVLLLSSLELSKSVITKKGNEYSGITVAIHKSISEEKILLLSKTIDLLKNTSALLYNVTDGQALFKHIDIIVPMSWNESTILNIISGLNGTSYIKTYGDFFREADIRINQTDTAYDDAPYTLQTGGCSEPGQYIHLTPNFILDENEIIKWYGPKDRNLVHEWMHLRYGIFDEYGIRGDKQFPVFYMENGKMHVSICNRNIKGTIKTPKGQKCTVENGLVTKECVFYPDKNIDDVSASIMSLTYLEKVTEYCRKDEGQNTGYEHNSRAPTKQNHYCDGMSVREVLDGHEDFRDSSKQKESSGYFPPEFRVLRPISLDSRFILVLDVSLSMKANMTIMHRTVQDFIEIHVPNGSYIGIVKYSTVAKTVQELIQINSTNRKVVSKNVPLNAEGYTSIGSGLQEALNVLERVNQPPEGATIILMTDGAENTGPFLNESISKIVKANIKVNTLAFGTQAEKALEAVAVATKGKTYFFDPTSSSSMITDLDLIFMDTVTIHADVHLQSEQIMRKVIDLTNVVVHEHVYIDDGLGSNTLFVLLGDQIPSSLEFKVVSPNGTVYNSTINEEHNKKESRRQIRLHIVESGPWNITINPGTATTSNVIRLQLLVTSEPRDSNHQLVRVDSWIKSIEVGETNFKVPRIYARVTKGFHVVVRAVVEATITNPQKHSITVILRDDGAGADHLQNDGIYSAYFTKFLQNGRYTVLSRVADNDGRALIKETLSFSGAQLIPKDHGEKLNDQLMSSFDLKKYFVNKTSSVNSAEPEGNKTGEFTRVVDAGSFSIDGLHKIDKIPPNRVNDLKVERVGSSSLSKNITNQTDLIVTLRWTSPGDDMDDGEAKELDIRTSVNDTQLRKRHFQHAIKIEENDVFGNGSLKPSLGGTIQTVSFVIPSETYDTNHTPSEHYFALRAVDNAGNMAEPSNIAVANVGYHIPEHVDPPTDPKGQAIVIGITVTVVAVVILVIVGYCVHKKFKFSRPGRS